MALERRDFDREAAAWDENPVRLKLADDVAAAIAQEVVLTADMDVLDFGCGTGLLTLRLQPFVRSITGVDSSQGMLDVFAAKIQRQHIPNVQHRLFDIEKDGALDGRYDLIVSSMTLHHVRMVQPLLGNCCGILSSGGRLCIADLEPDEGLFHDSNEGVFHSGFDRALLREMFVAAGFDDVCDRTAAHVVKPIHGGMRSFDVFLTVGRKAS